MVCQRRELLRLKDNVAVAIKAIKQNLYNEKILIVIVKTFLFRRRQGGKAMREEKLVC
jgi:hypothetical protein